MKYSIAMVSLSCLCVVLLLKTPVNGEEQAAVKTDNKAAIAGYLNGSAVSPFHQSLKGCFQQLEEQKTSLSLPEKPENPELLAMVICSKLLDTSEKQYWLDTLPRMTDEQRQQLQNTLAAEFRKSGDPAVRQLSLVSIQLSWQHSHAFNTMTADCSAEGYQSAGYSTTIT